MPALSYEDFRYVVYERFAADGGEQNGPAATKEDPRHAEIETSGG